MFLGLCSACHSGEPIPNTASDVEATRPFCRIAPILFQTFLFTLTVAARRQSRERRLVNRGIIDLFVRDGTWAFSLISGTFSPYNSTALAYSTTARFDSGSIDEPPPQRCG